MILLQTIIVYLFSLSLMVYYSRKSSMYENNILYFLIPIIVFSLLSGLRYGVGIDYNSYLELYNYWGVFDFGYDRLEPAFLAVLSLTNSISPDNPILYFSILGFLQIFFIFLAFKERREFLPYICFVLIFSGIAMQGFMNGIRQTIAFSIFVYSIRFIIQRKCICYYLCVFVAFLFHKSALLLIPFYFVKYPLFSNVGVQLLLLMVSFMAMMFNPLQSIVSSIDDLAILLGYGGYLDISMQSKLIGSASVGMITFVKLFIYALIIVKSVDMKRYFSDNLFNVIYDLFLIGVCFSYLFRGSQLLNRSILYFAYMEIFVMAYVLMYFYKKRNMVRMNFAYCILLFSFMIYTFCNIMATSEYNTTQYVFYFQDELHYLKDLQKEQMFLNNK